MKRVLLLLISIMLVANVAMADHIAIYGDAAGSYCNLAPGFSITATVIHKFSTGATGSRFSMDLSLCPGTTFFGFSTPYVPVGWLTTGILIEYGGCLTGSNPLGTIVALWAPGAVSIVPAPGFANVIYTDCNFVEKSATGGHASINGDGHGCDIDAIQPSTWGQVKALYR